VSPTDRNHCTPGIADGAAHARGREPAPLAVRIRALEGSRSLPLLWDSLRAVWEYHELLFFLAWRDVKVRYKQTVLGAAWVVLQPLLLMVVFSVFFGALARTPSEGIPYWIFVYCGLVPWQLFAFALSSSGNALVTNERLLTKVYFPRLVLPIAAVLSGLLDFALSFLVLVLMMAYYGIAPAASLWALPVFILLAFIAPTAVGIGLAALSVRFRDVRHTLPFLTQFWLLATPIGYSSSLIPERWRALYGLNPMVGVVEGFRWALLGGAEPSGALLLVAVGMVFVVLVVSLVYFVRVESTLADVV
jgi:lipopolysaccharide transport system permease protein